jgi:hypothetical protein
VNERRDEERTRETFLEHSDPHCVLVHVQFMVHFHFQIQNRDNDNFESLEHKVTKSVVETVHPDLIAEQNSLRNEHVMSLNPRVRLQLSLDSKSTMLYSFS